MRIKYLALLSCVLVPLTVSLATASEQPPSVKGYPVEVALEKTLKGDYRWVQPTTELPLYVYEKDSPGKSNCLESCAQAWPPLEAGDSAGPVGDWTVLPRNDGSRQWAYKNQPVYLRFDDSATDPQGYEPPKGWRFLAP